MSRNKRRRERDRQPSRPAEAPAQETSAAESLRFLGAPIRPERFGPAIKHAIGETADAISYSAYPTIGIVATLAWLYSSMTPEFQAKVTDPVNLQNMIVRVCYFSYISLASIYLYLARKRLHDFWRTDFTQMKWMHFFLFVVALVSFCNQFIGFLLAEANLPLNQAFHQKSITAGAAGYVVAVLLMLWLFFTESMFLAPRDAAHAAPAKSVETPPPRSKAASFLASGEGIVLVFSLLMGLLAFVANFYFSATQVFSGTLAAFTAAGFCHQFLSHYIGQLAKPPDDTQRKG